MKFKPEDKAKENPRRPEDDEDFDGFRLCPECEGRGFVDGELCLTCDGLGVVYDD